MSDWCPPGQTLCPLCFGCFSKDQLYTDHLGLTWDTCKGACAVEAGLVTAHAWLDGREIILTLRSVVLPHPLGATVDGVTVTETPEQLGWPLVFPEQKEEP